MVTLPAAVQHVAPIVFGVPVVVPPPAEYVALGVARQAAWVLATLEGQASHPTWNGAPETVLEASDNRDEGQLIRAAYRSLQETVHAPGPPPIRTDGALPR